MRKYLFQRFLPNCDTTDFLLENYFTINNQEGSMISISTLDEKIDTEEDLRKFLSQFIPTDTIIIVNDRQIYSNPILRDYALKTLKSYLFWINKYGYKCYWTTPSAT